MGYRLLGDDDIVKQQNQKATAARKANTGTVKKLTVPVLGKKATATTPVANVQALGAGTVQKKVTTPTVTTQTKKVTTPTVEIHALGAGNYGGTKEDTATHIFNNAAYNTAAGVQGGTVIAGRNFQDVLKTPQLTIGQQAKANTQAELQAAEKAKSRRIQSGKLYTALDRSLEKTQQKGLANLQKAEEYSTKAMEGKGKVGGTLTEAAMTVANMVPQIAVGALTGGAGGALMVAGTSAGTDYLKKLQEGKDEYKSRNSAMAVGAAEGALQYLLGGIEKLSGAGKLTGKLDDAIAAMQPGIKKAAAYLATQTGREITEEEAQLFLEPLINKIAFGGSYTAPQAEEILRTALITALSTGALDAGSAVTAGQSAQGFNFAQKLTDANGMTYDERTDWQRKMQTVPKERQGDFLTAYKVAQRYGAQLDVSAMENAAGSYQNGIVTISPTTENPVRQVLIHELTHHMETGGMYGDFQSRVMTYMQDSGLDIDSMLQGIQEDYAAAGQSLTSEAAEKELVAKFAESRLFQDETTVQRLLTDDRNLFQRIYDWIRDAVTKAKGTSEEQFLRNAEKLYEKALRQATGQSQGKQLLYAGKNAKTADLQALDRAITMEKAGNADAEAIRRETGWFRGMDGKWRFELDDSGMKLRNEGGNIPSYGTVGSALDAQELLRAYPDLENSGFWLETLEQGKNGGYDRQFDTIELNRSLKGKPGELMETTVHELQHAIQAREGFTQGTSPKYWENQIQNGFDSRREATKREEARLQEQYRQLQESNPQFVKEMEALDDMTPTVPRGKIDWNTLEQIEPDPAEWVSFDARRDELEKKYGEDAVFNYFNLRDTLKNVQKNGRNTPTELYYNTAGEIEARDAANRRTLTAEQRRETAPARRNEDTVYEPSFQSDTQRYIEQQKAKKRVANLTGKPYEQFEKSYSTGRSFDELQPILTKEGIKFGAQDVDTVGKIENEINQAGLNLTSKDNNKNNLRIRAWLQENYPNIHVEFFNDKSSGTVSVKSVESQEKYIADIENRDRAAKEQRDRIAAKERFYERVKTISGNQRLYDSIDNHLQKSGYKDMGFTMHRSRSTVGTNSFYIEMGTHTIKVSDHNTISQELGYNNDAFINVRECASISEVWEKVKNVLDKIVTEENGAGQLSTGRSFDELQMPRLETYAEYTRRMAAQRYAEEAQSRLDTLTDEDAPPVYEGQDTDTMPEPTDPYTGTRRQVQPEEYAPAQEEAAGALSFTRENISAKADRAITRAERTAQRDIARALGATAEESPRIAETVKALSNTYLAKGEIDSDTRESLFNRLYGAYDPAAETDTFPRKVARNDFDAAVDMLSTTLNDARRYETDRAAREKSEITPEDVQKAYKDIKKLRREKNRTEARTLLTNEDKAVLGRLLRGEVDPATLDASNRRDAAILQNYEASRAYNEAYKTISKYRKERKSQRLAEAKNHLNGAVYWKDKKSGFAYSRETMERNVRDIARTAEGKPAINEAEGVIAAYFRPVHEKEAEATRAKNTWRDRVRKLGLSQQVAKGNEISEAYAVQFLGEAENAMATATTTGKDVEGKSLEDWKGLVDDLWKNNPNLDREKVNRAIEEFRAIYDELLEQQNTVRVENGYEPIAYRKGYFPHFRATEADGVLASMGNALGITADITPLPTTINGMTAQFKPGIRWQANAMERTGYETVYDCIEGFEKYLDPAMSVIYQTENIQNLRALAEEARYMTSDEGIQKQIDDIRADTELSEVERKAKIDALYENGHYTLSNFVAELDEYTNLLAGKRSRLDRGVESMIGRRFYNVAKALEGRVAANMVAVNPASWLTNFIPITQAWGSVSGRYIIKGMTQTLQGTVGKQTDGVREMSSFLTNRAGSEPLSYKKRADKWAAVAGKGMELIDQFTSETIVRARYAQNLKQGMTEEAAIENADAFAAGLMADRSKGSMPTLFESRNPAVKLLTQFQLEVNNQFSYLFKDLPNDMKDKGLASLAAALFKMAVGSWLYNEVYEYFVGRRPALDPLDMLNDTVGDITGYQLPNMVDYITGEDRDFTTQKENAYGVAKNLATNAVEEAPFVGGLIGGGRLPINSALPDVENLSKAALNSDWSAKKRITTAAKELAKPALYVGLPFGGGQLKKAVEGASAIARQGSYAVNAEGEKELQYAVDASAGDIAKIALFGKSATQGARNWVDSDFDGLSAKETRAYDRMIEDGMQATEAFETVQQISKTEKTATVSKAEAQRQALQSADISDSAKAAIYGEMLAGDEEKSLIDSMVAGGTDEVALYKTLSGLHSAEDTADKLDVVMESGLTDGQKAEVYKSRLASAEELEKMEEITADSGMTDVQYMAYKQAVAGLSQKADKLNAVDALDISDTMKDYLYYAMGYSESTIDEAPWHSSAATTGAPRLVYTGKPTLKSTSAPRLVYTGKSTLKSTSAPRLVYTGKIAE